jgi:hypothetical protein
MKKELIRIKPEEIGTWKERIKDSRSDTVMVLMERTLLKWTLCISTAALLPGKTWLIIEEAIVRTLGEIRGTGLTQAVLMFHM